MYRIPDPDPQHRSYEKRAALLTCDCISSTVSYEIGTKNAFHTACIHTIGILAIHFIFDTSGLFAGILLNTSSTVSRERIKYPGKESGSNVDPDPTLVA
jgi:hypothetical protein